MDRVTIGLPSKGAIAEPTLQFLHDCGLRVEKPNPRQYTGTIPALSDVEVLFQRVTDVVYKVADGTAQLGITGLDVVHEYDSDEVVVIHPDLRYGQCRLVVSVPEAWVDVESMSDLAEVALDFREFKRRNIRVATTYPNMARKFLHSHGIHHFALANAEGAIEAAPTIGYADLIVDLVQTGTTLRENHLKALPDGIALEAQACLIGNRRALHEHPLIVDTVRTLLEHIDGSLQGKTYSQITANIAGVNQEEIANRVAANPLTHGLQGPTIAPIFGSEIIPGKQWFTITITVGNKHLLTSIEHLRALGAKQATVTPLRYLFLESSPSFSRLNEHLSLSRHAGS